MVGRMKVAAVQFDIVTGQIERNLEAVLAALQRLRRHNVCLTVLPEMWSSGFDYRSLGQLAQKTPEVLETIARHPAALDMVVVGSLPEYCDGDVYNTTFVLDRGRIAGRYRKLHLFSPMCENRYMRAGNTALVVETAAGRIGVAICYDLRFPELFRRLSLDGADLICLSAQWPRPRQDHWQTLIKARAIENQVFMVAANNCGMQGKLDFFGNSMIVSPHGEVAAEGGDKPCEILAEIDGEAQQAYRQAIPAWKDRRPDVYGVLT